MRDRDSNETGQSHASQPSPEVTQPESLSRPLITEDYGLPDALAAIAALDHSRQWVIRASCKVTAGTRYVFEIEAVKLGDSPLALDVQSAGGSTE